MTEPEGVSDRSASVTMAPLSLTALYETYQDAGVGAQEPTHMHASPRTLRAVRFFFAGVLGLDEPLQQFNQAMLVPDDHLPDGVVAFRGGHHPVYLLFATIAEDAAAMITVGQRRIA
jgi:hypothetical protein